MPWLLFLRRPWWGSGMTELTYVITVKGPVPASLSRRVAEAHVESIKSRRWGKNCANKQIGPSGGHPSS